jgi:two-component system, chemotaxis family, sensor kinase Cph1
VSPPNRAPSDFVVDISNCEREPIHIPGAIQPHGVLIALSGPEPRVTQVSENVAQHLGCGVEEVLGRRLVELLDGASLEAVRAALAVSEGGELRPLRVLARATPFDGLVHRHLGAAILELEPIIPPAPAKPVQDPLRHALKGLQHARSTAELCEIAVREVKGLTGFERVMIYRFDDEGHGAVVAEAREPRLDPYLDLHYPASDIPEQARALYLKTWVRMIPDARHMPARIVPALRPDTGAPLDLSFAVLRSISPIHLEYLANMGIRASMSVSLIVRDRLWGLISCANHSGPRRIRYELRAAAEVLGRLISLQLAAFADREAAGLRAARRGTLDALALAMRAGEPHADALESLVAQPADLLKLVGAGGAAVIGAGEPVVCGQVPTSALLWMIASWLEERGEAATFSTESLAKQVPAAEQEKEVASGLLTFSLPGTPRRRLLWFRPEMVRTVSWGGDPRRPAEADPSMRLHPRRSFDLWKEEVRLRACPWSASDVEAADELRRAAVEIDLERQVLREQRAVRARDDLVAVVSHDLRSPLGVVQMQAALILRAASSGEDERSRRLREGAGRIQRAVDRMNALIRDLLDLAKIEAGRSVLHPRSETVGEIVEDTLTLVRPLADAKRIAIVEELAAQVLIEVDRERIFQVLSNLLGNAIKFTPEGGRIAVRAERRGAEVLFTIADTGPGIAPDSLPHVFDRYWQARRGGHGGAGLGLYIAKGIVEAHGGRIWVDSPPGSGARFHFSVPAG